LTTHFHIVNFAGSDEVSGFLVETIVKDVPITQSNLRQKNDKALSKLRGKARVGKTKFPQNRLKTTKKSNFGS